MKRAYNFFLRDILNRIADIKSFTTGMNLELFRSDRKTQFAVLRCLEIIGEAVTHIPEEVKGQNPQIQWRKIRSFRNVATHQYWEVEPEMVWNIIEDFLRSLEKDIVRIIDEIDSMKN